MAKMVFVVGAGASTGFRFPLGGTLASEIRVTLDNEFRDVASMRPVMNAAMLHHQHDGGSNDFGEAFRNICGGLVTARSIDRYLHSRRNLPLVVTSGKCAIAENIGRKELESPLGAAVSANWDSKQAALLSVTNTWISRLFAILSDGVAPENAASILRDITFITFNYDRLIERYLHLAFTHVMGLLDNDVAAILDQVPILHVYGSLGSLKESDGNHVPFGSHESLVQRASAGIRIFTEGANEQTISQAQTYIQQAETIVFLGFAFDQLNIEAIVPTPLRHDQRVLGTRLGLLPSDQERIRFSITGSSNNQPMLDPVGCSDFVESDRFRTELANLTR